MVCFTTHAGQVEMHLGDGPVPLTDRDCEALLDVLEPIDGYAAAKLFNALYDAHRATGGMERCTSRRAA